MFALESIAALVTIFGGVAALLVWTFGRVAAFKRENASLRAQLADLQTAPRQPPGCDYLEDRDGAALCIHCYSTAGQRWKLIKENGQQRCPVCGKTTAH